MKIVESEDWLTYKSVWKECMKDYYWYKNNPIFDWNKDEELEDMETDFGKAGQVFLEAHHDDKIVGVFSFRYRGKEAMMMRWEPAVLKSSDDNEIRSALLSYALDYLSGKGVEHTKVVMKYQVGNRDIAKPLLDLYQQSGFGHYQPDSVDLITSLDDIPSPPSMPDNVSINRDLGTIPENIGAYCVRAYGTTPADIEIHGFDKSVTEYESAVSITNAIMGSRFGRSPREFWKVAVIDNTPAGFIGGFIKESNHQPLTGVLGPLGVFPEFRRLGIGVFLVSELFKSMKNQGCEYTAVGTPFNNRNAIAMYQKAGYKMNCHLTFLEKML